MSTQHTPAPWKATHPIQDADAARHIWTQTDPATGHRELVAIIPGAEGDHVSADARLIAAAPDMLAALQLALHALENARIEYDYHGNPMDKCDADVITAVDTLRAAIAKATGEQP
jgi:hypothetical protein